MKRPALARLLKELLETGAVPLSQVSASARAALAPQFAAGILGEERSGAGARIAVRNKAVLAAYADQLFPSGLNSAPAGAAPRAAAVARYRDAKAAGATAAEPVFIRAFNGFSFNKQDQTLPAAELTRKYGTAALVLGEPPPWHCGGTLAVVENLEPFLCFERLKVPADAAIYAGGRMSARLLAWLAAPEMAGCALLHCGDYDPVGIDEYLRLKQACGARAKLHLPADLAELFRKYGKRALLADSAAVLRRLRATTDPDALRVIEMMNATNSGLEQESLLLHS